MFEPITDINKTKYNVTKIEYPILWGMYKEQQNFDWKAEEIDFSKDYDDFIKLEPEVQNIIKMILAFFANADGIVNFNIGARIMNEITIIEAKMAYQFQIAIENVHNETYSLMLNTLIKDEDEREYLSNSITTIPAIKLMTDWALKWINDEKTTLGERLVAFACVEGIFFSGAFAIIFWLKNYKSKTKTCMKGLVDSNNLIARDEALHCKFGCELYKMLNNKLSILKVNEIVNDSVLIAQNFVIETLKCPLIGINADLMKNYIEHVADHLLVNIGCKKIYYKSNPFKWMDSIGMVQKSNFHEMRPTEYQSSHKKVEVKQTTAEDDF
jgi:ribonucleotide reductase beta subunit family protein with ferritin-like domain